MSSFTLSDLERIVAERAASADAGSYTVSYTHLTLPTILRV